MRVILMFSSNKMSVISKMLSSSIKILWETGMSQTVHLSLGVLEPYFPRITTTLGSEQTPNSNNSYLWFPLIFNSRFGTKSSHLWSSCLLPLLVKKQYSRTSILPGETFYFSNSFSTNAPLTLYANFPIWETHWPLCRQSQWWDRTL